MRTTVSIDDELLRQAKRAAVDSARSLSDLVSEALREMLLRRKQAPGQRIRLITSGHNSRVVPGLDFSDNAAVRAAMDEYEWRQMTVSGTTEEGD